MQLVADESVDLPIVIQLRQAEHEVFYVAEMEPGLPDEKVLAVAKQRNAPLLTSDKDFGDLVFRQHKLFSGLILIRLEGFSSAAKSKIVLKTIEEFGEKLVGNIAVIGPGMVRVRSKIDGRI